MIFLLPLTLLGLFTWAEVRKEKVTEAVTKALGIDDL